MWVMGEWSVGQWIVGVISFQKMYGLYGLKSIYIGINAHVTIRNERTIEDRTTQPLNWKAEFRNKFQKECENLKKKIHVLAGANSGFCYRMEM